MIVEGRVIFPAPRDRVWAALLDPAVVSSSIPGCEKLEETEEDTYEAVLRIGVGPISGRYRGTLRVIEKNAPRGYSMAFEGSGAQGFVRGSGTASLTEENAGTLVLYRCDVEVGGLIASVGHRVLQGVSRYLLDQMFARMRSLVTREDTHETLPV